MIIFGQSSARDIRIVPGCCDTSILMGIPYIRHFDEEDCERREFSPGPRWRIAPSYPGWSKTAFVEMRNRTEPEPKYCPFCSAPVPEIVLRDTGDRPVHNSDNGNYCDVCDKRNNECECNYPELRYMVAGSDNDLSELDKAYEQHIKECRQYDD